MPGAWPVTKLLSPRHRPQGFKVGGEVLDHEWNDESHLIESIYSMERKWAKSLDLSQSLSASESA
jgi:hypothetical protein